MTTPTDTAKLADEIEGRSSQKKGPQPKPLADRFAAGVIRPDDGSSDQCWLWRGKSRSDGGYPIIFVRGRHLRVSRVAWELHNSRPFPEGMFACHSCDNPACVNPEHIWPGTAAQNMRDAVNKKRPLGAKAKPFCKRGHAQTPENTKYSYLGHRFCAACKRIQLSQYKARRRARAALGGAG